MTDTAEIKKNLARICKEQEIVFINSLEIQEPALSTHHTIPIINICTYCGQQGHDVNSCRMKLLNLLPSTVSPNTSAIVSQMISPNTSTTLSNTLAMVPNISVSNTLAMAPNTSVTGAMITPMLPNSNLFCNRYERTYYDPSCNAIVTNTNQRITFEMRDSDTLEYIRTPCSKCNSYNHTIETCLKNINNSTSNNGTNDNTSNNECIII